MRTTKSSIRVVGALSYFTDSMLSQCSHQAQEDLHKLDDKLRKQLAWTDATLLRSILLYADTCNWIVLRSEPDSECEEEEEIDDKAELRPVVEYIVSIYGETLEAKGACLFSLDDKLEEVVHFCRK